ncbi:MAG: hypothetical protein QG635_2270, partial [Bacteroidota bacterium]|nr:hypothetical protein [Bacteroidota bacterium]
NYVVQLGEIFRADADPENAAPMKKYMGCRFEFFGIKTEKRRKLCREYIQSCGIPDYEDIQNVIVELWSQPEREFQYFGQELLEKYVRQFEPDIINLLEYMLLNKSWWDTVDIIATNLIGAYFKKFPDEIEPITKKWIKSKKLWLSRAALLFQNKYKTKTREELLFSIIHKTNRIDDFFIRKAIGWALREYSKTNPDSVRSFIDRNNLPRLSKREAMTYLG